jgi:hypothetical protein
MLTRIDQSEQSFDDEKPRVEFNFNWAASIVAGYGPLHDTGDYYLPVTTVCSEKERVVCNGEHG